MFLVCIHGVSRVLDRGPHHSSALMSGTTRGLRAPGDGHFFLCKCSVFQYVLDNDHDVIHPKGRMTQNSLTAPDSRHFPEYESKRSSFSIESTRTRGGCWDQTVSRAACDGLPCHLTFRHRTVQTPASCIRVFFVRFFSTSFSVRPCP